METDEGPRRRGPSAPCYVGGYSDSAVVVTSVVVDASGFGHEPSAVGSTSPCFTGQQIANNVTGETCRFIIRIPFSQSAPTCKPLGRLLVAANRAASRKK